MATQIIQKLLSDLSGEECHKTTNFALDGKTYMIDLTDEEDAELREFLQRYIDNGTKVNATTRTGKDRWLYPSEKAPGVPNPYQDQKARAEYLDTVRKWAKPKGFHVAERGRVPQTVLDLYEKRHMLESEDIIAAAAKVNATLHNAAHQVIVNGTVPQTNGHTAPEPVAAEAKKAVPVKAAAKKTTPAKKITAPAKKVTAKKTNGAAPALFSHGEEATPARRPAKKTTKAAARTRR